VSPVREAILTIIPGLAAAVVLLYAVRARPRPPRHVPAHADQAERASMARLRGEPPPATVPVKAVGGHPPWPVEPLEPLPELADDEEPFESDTEFIESVAHLLPPAALAEAADEIDSLVQDVKQRFGLAKPPPPPPAHEPLLARYERLIDSRPAQVQELLHHHRDSEDAVNSIMFRTLDPELLATLDAAKALASGQVSDA
jgi:hypothetical protein